jgi:hypothetical protein
VSAKLAIALALAIAAVACERVVDLTPPDSGSMLPDAAVSEVLDAHFYDDAGIGSDGNDAIPPPDAFTIDAPP